jgi:hypothetical protein
MTDAPNSRPEAGEETYRTYRAATGELVCCWDELAKQERTEWAAAEHRARTTGPLWEGAQKWLRAWDTQQARSISVTAATLRVTIRSLIAELEPPHD